MADRRSALLRVGAAVGAAIALAVLLVALTGGSEETSGRPEVVPPPGNEYDVHALSLRGTLPPLRQPQGAASDPATDGEDEAPVAEASPPAYEPPTPEPPSLPPEGDGGDASANEPPSGGPPSGDGNGGVVGVGGG